MVFLFARIPGFFLLYCLFSNISATALRQALLWCLLAASVIAYERQITHHTDQIFQSLIQKNILFQSEAANPPQNKSMRTRMDAVRVQSTRLNELSEKIKSFMKHAQKFYMPAKLGVGGSYSKKLAFSLSDPKSYNQWVNDLVMDFKQLDDSVVVQFDEYHLLLNTIQEMKKIQDATPCISPVTEGRISSNFGYRESPFKEAKEFHSGLDISSRKGTPVLATADGFVVFAGYNGDLGKQVVIDHGFGIVTTYGHLSEFKVKVGQKVKRGAVIAKVGNTGRSTGPHLHYEVRLNNIPINPKKYIPQYLASRDLSK